MRQVAAVETADEAIDAARAVLLSAFLPAQARELVDDVATATIARGHPSASAHLALAPPRVVDGVLHIGGSHAPVVVDPPNPELVPSPLFFDTDKHTETLGRMLRAWMAGERHLLLMGNQGVGKNKLADRFLQLLGRGREYMQVRSRATHQPLSCIVIHQCSH